MTDLGAEARKEPDGSLRARGLLVRDPWLVYRLARSFRFRDARAAREPRAFVNLVSVYFTDVPPSLSRSRDIGDYFMLTDDLVSLDYFRRGQVETVEVAWDGTHGQEFSVASLHYRSGFGALVGYLARRARMHDPGVSLFHYDPYSLHPT